MNATHPATHPEADVMTIPAVCQRLAVSRETLRRWRYRGLPYRKINRAVRFVWSDVLLWLEQHRQSHSPVAAD